ERPVVAALGVGDAAVGEQRAEQAGHQGGAEAADVGVDEGHDVAGGDGEGLPQRLALAVERGQVGQDGVLGVHVGPGAGGHGGGVVGGAGVDDHDLVHQAGELAADDADDVTHGVPFVTGGQDHH